MNRTITAVFDTEAEALRAREALAAQGFDRASIHVHRHSTTAHTGASDPNTDKGFWQSLAELFVPDDDRPSYEEAARRGGVVLSMQADDSRFASAADILEANGAVDLDEREASWRSEGWTGRASSDGLGYGQPDGTPGNPSGTMLSRGVDDALGTNISGARPEHESAARTASVVDRSINGGPRMGADINNAGGNPPGTMLSRGADDVLGTNMSGARPENEDHAVLSAGPEARLTPPMPMPTRDVGAEGGHAVLPAGATSHEAIPVVEERLRVGKRETGHGRVRIRSYVVETPVEEQVTLRREHVEVERRDMNQPVAATDELFRERVIEATETQEEAVIAKEARVTGEVSLRKDTDVHTETVRDTVRRTEVEVEREDDTTRGLKRDI